MTTTAQYLALIPAAGIGVRFGGALPKQYQEIAGKPILQYVLDVFGAHRDIAHTFVVVNERDTYIDRLHLHNKMTVVRRGGNTRQESVWNGLQAMQIQATHDDWILVHDAVRPGLDAALISHLMTAMQNEAVGGLLALPIVDTLKQSAGAPPYVQCTLPRQNAWAAQTPQMFRYGLLRHALEQAQAKQAYLSDDASAVEMLGLQPKLVAGSPRNFKITWPHDIALAEFLLERT